MGHAQLHGYSMNRSSYSCWSRLIAVAAIGWPSLASAHPGHYHPDETDEFDFLRAMFFHSHGSLDYVVAAVAISSMVVAFLHGDRTVRISAGAMALASVCMLPVL